MKIFTVENELSDVRCDKYLIDLLGISRTKIQKLIEKNLIKESGRLDVPGRPILYSTTDEFLRQFELNDLKELPSLDLFDNTDETEEILNESEIEKTLDN